MKDFDFFNIDINMLDKEWLHQAELFFQWAVKLADARGRLEQAKGELDLTKAECDKAIRESPEDFGIKKATETQVSLTIITLTEYKEALKTYQAAQYEVNVNQAAVQALDHRKSALERLVSLHGQKYFAQPQGIDEESKEAADHIAKKSIRRNRSRANK